MTGQVLPVVLARWYIAIIPTISRNTGRRLMFSGTEVTWVVTDRVVVVVLISGSPRS